MQENISDQLVKQKILTYLENQAAPRTFREIKNYLLLSKTDAIKQIAELFNDDKIGRSVIDGIPHYFFKQPENTMKIQPIQAYPANDGTLFTTEAEAIAHNIGLEQGPKIDEFMDYRNLDNKARGMQKSIITKWEVYKATDTKPIEM
jgi:hypothetical protein